MCGGINQGMEDSVVEDKTLKLENKVYENLF